MKPHIRKIKNRRRLLGSACAGVVAALAASSASAQAVPELILDLRVAGGGKTVNISSASPTANLELFALVLDPDVTASNTGFNATQGIWTSSNGGLQGNLLASLISPFDNGSGSQNPTPADRDGDGDLDVGPSSQSATSGFFIASNGSAGYFLPDGTETIGSDTYRRFKIGAGTFTPTSFSSAGSTQISFLPRIGDAITRPHKYLKDSNSTLTSIKGDDSRLNLGSAVTVSLAGVNYTWTRGAATSEWGATGNWDTAGIPSSPLDTAIFTNTGVGTVALSNEWTVGGLNFSNTSGGYTISNGSGPTHTLTINNGSGVGTINDTGSGTATFAAGMNINAAQLDINTVSGGGPLTINSLVTATILNKNGSGNLTLAGSGFNNLGAVNVNSGTVRAQTTGALGNGVVTMNASSTLQLASNNAMNVVGPMIIAGNATINVDRLNSGSGISHLLGDLTMTGPSRSLTLSGGNGYDLTVGGITTLDGASTFSVNTVGSDLALAGAVVGAGSLIKSGNGTMILNGTAANSFTAGTTVSAGTLVLGKPNGVNAVGGSVVVNGGTLLWQSDEQIPNGSNITLNSGGTINLNGHTETVNVFIDNGGTTIFGGGTLITGDLNLTNGTTIASQTWLGGNLNYTGTTTAATVSGAVNVTSNLVNHNFTIANGTADPDVSITGAITGASNVTKLGAGTLTYGGTNANTLSGLTTVSAGVLNLNKPAGTDAIAGPLEILGGTVVLQANNQINNGSTVNIGPSGTLDMTSRQETIASLIGSGTILGGGAQLTVNTNNLSTTFSGNITNGLGLRNGGIAEIRLTGNNTLSNISTGAGTVTVASAANMGGASVTLEPGGKIRADGTFSTASTFTDLAAGDTGIEVTSGSTLTMTGDLIHQSGAVNLVKSGSGTLVLSGNMFAYHSNITVAAGTLALTAGRTLDVNSVFTVDAGATADLSGTLPIQRMSGLMGAGHVIVGSTLNVHSSDDPSDFSGQITGAGSIYKTGSETLTLSGTSSIGDNLVIEHGTLAVSGAGSVTTLGSLQVLGESSSPNLDIVGGGTVSAASGFIATSPGASSVTLQGEGSRLQISGNLSVGAYPSLSSGNGSVDIDEGATLDVGGTITLHDNGSSEIGLNGGTIRAASLVSSESTRFQWDSGTLELNALNIDNSSPLGQNVGIDQTKTLVVGELSVSSSVGSILTVSDGGALRSKGNAMVTVAGPSETGTVSVTGSGSSWTLTNLGALNIGAGGGGSVGVSNGGAIVADGNIVVGGNLQGNGMLGVDGAESRVATSAAIDIGSAGMGTLSVTNGGSVSAGTLSVRGVDGGSMGITTGTVSAAEVNIFDSLNTIGAGGSLKVGEFGLTMTEGEITLAADSATPGTLVLAGPLNVAPTSTGSLISSGTVGANQIRGTLDLLGDDRVFAVDDGAASDDLSISARITNGGIQKIALGTLLLTAENSYSGQTMISGGSIALGRNDAIPAASAVMMENGSALELRDFSTVVASLESSDPTSVVNLTTGVLTAGGDNTSKVYAGNIIGTTGGIIKQGTGTWTISGDLSFAGSIAQQRGIVINEGTLSLTGINSSLSAPIYVRSTGAGQGTLAVATDNLGSGSLTLDSGRLLVSNSFTRSNDITLAVGGGTITVDSGATLSLDGALAGQGGLIKTGPGTLDLFSASSYVGGTSIRDGNVVARVAGAIPSSTNIDIQSSPQLGTNGSLEIRSSQMAASLSGNGSVSLLNSSFLTVGAGGATTEFEGGISGTGGIAKQGSGSLTLSGALSFNGSLAVNGGTVILDGTGAFAGPISAGNGGMVSAGSDANLGAAGNEISLNGGTLQVRTGFDTNRTIDIGAGGGTIDVVAGQLNHHGSTTSNNQLLKTGAGTLAFDNPASFSGPIKVNGGAVALHEDATLTGNGPFTVNTGGKFALINTGNSQHDRIGDSAAVTLAGGEFHFVGAAADNSSETLGQLTLSGGASTIRLEEGVAGTTEVHFASLAAPVAGATVDFAMFAAGTTNKLFFDAAPPPMEGWATVSGSDFAIYTANGVEAMTSYTTAFGPGNNVKLTATPGAPVTATDAATLILESATAVDVALNGQTLTLSKGGLIKSGSGSASISGGSLTSGNGQLAVTTTGAPALTVSATLTGSMDLLKSGSGTLILDAANSFSGTTYVNAGTLQIEADNNLGASGNDVHFNGGTLNVVDDVTFSASRTLEVGSGGGEIDIPLDVTASLPNASQLSGSGSLTKSGQGVLHIGGSNTYIGHLTVARGTLQLDHTDALGTGSSRGVIVMDQGSQLHLRSDASPATFGYDVVVSDVNNFGTVATINTAKLTPSGTPGVFELGSLTIGNATLRYDGTEGTLAFTGVTTLTGAATIETVRDLTLAGRITGPGSLEKSGDDASLTLGSGPSDTAANTYTDDTIISGGKLILNKAAGTIAIRGDIIMNGGTLSLNQPQQIADTSKVGIGAAATFDVAKSDSVSDLDIAGQAKIRDGANFSSDTTKVKDGGKIEVGDETNTTPSSFTTRSAILEGSGLPGPILGLKGTGSSNLTSGVSAMTANARQTIVVTEGLTFSGVASESSSIKLVEDLVDAGELQLSADVLNSSTTGTAQILSVLPTGGGSNLKKGTVALQGLRTFTIGNTVSDMLVTAQVTNLPTDTGTINGGIKKMGPGKLILTAGNTYSLGTTIQQGTLEARGGTLGTGTITLGGAGLDLTRLHLRNNAASVNYGNDLTVVGDSTIDIDRLDDASTLGVMKLGRLNLKNRLKVTGANGRSLEFGSASTLTGPAIVQNSVPVSINAGISGPHPLTMDAGGSTLTFGGSAANDYTGSTNVNLGTLELNKPAGTTAIPGPLNVIGGGVVKWMASDQVADTSALSITAVGVEDSKFDLNGRSDTVASLTMTAGTVTTSGGVLKLNGNLTSLAASKSAKIMGQLSLDTTRTFTVEDSPSIDDELIVEADVSGKGGILKAGAGQLVLSGNNSFTGGVSISAGTVKTLGASSLSGAVNLAVTTGTYDLPGGLTTTANAVVTKSGAGAMVVRGAQSHGTGARLQLDGGSIALNTDAGSASSRTLTIAASAGSLTLGSTQHVASFSTTGTAIATLMAGGNKVLVTDSISATGSAKLDLKDGALIVRNGVVGGWDGSKYTGIAGLVDAGRNLGAWDGFGIVTTQSNAILPKMRTTLATMKASEVEGATSTFRGETVTSGDVIVAYTWGGDANLNGMIDADDFFRIDSHVGQSAGAFGFSNGDFNYDGLVNGDDYFVLDSNYNAQGSPLGAVMALSQPEVKEILQSTGGELSAGVTAVPEPSAIALIALAAPALLKRRRRSR